MIAAKMENDFAPATCLKYRSINHSGMAKFSGMPNGEYIR